jgi:hypothetical protein
MESYVPSSEYESEVYRVFDELKRACVAYGSERSVVLPKAVVERTVVLLETYLMSMSRSSIPWNDPPTPVKMSCVGLCQRPKVRGQHFASNISPDPSSLSPGVVSPVKSSCTCFRLKSPVHKVLFPADVVAPDIGYHISTGGDDEEQVNYSAADEGTVSEHSDDTIAPARTYDAPLQRVEIKIPPEDIACGDAFKGEEFVADIVCYHKETAARVVRRVSDGRHFFVPREIIATPGKLKRPNRARSMDDRMFSFRLKDGTLVDAKILYEFGNGIKLYRLVGLPDEEGNFWGGYHMCSHGPCDRIREK